MHVVAEGVETTAQLEKIRHYGADSVQGFLFSRALPAAEFQEFCASFAVRTWPAA
jgi:EAL domain-containing protein (putative c-di-GMP-specific phosphodiesterase class I)